MPKLKTREIIILAVTVLALLYGGYDLFLAKGKKTVTVDATKNIAELQTFMTEMTVVLGKDTPSPVDAHMIRRSEAAWVRDPFYNRKAERAWAMAGEAAQAAGTAAAPKSLFSYTGYVEAGDRQIVVINGHEYVAGDALEVEGYVLKAVHPTRVSIYNRETRRTMDVPLQE
jgi:hypothetical protein